MDMDQTRCLLAKSRQGDLQARSELVDMNLPLVHSIARRFIDRGLEYDDLLQIGSLGLLKAINDFDLNYEVRFSTYAVPKIMGEIKQHLRRTSRLTVSRSTKRLASDALHAKIHWHKPWGEIPPSQKLPPSSGWRRKKWCTPLMRLSSILCKPKLIPRMPEPRVPGSGGLKRES